MPNRYEREIEEILSRMEESEPRKGLGDRIRPFRRPARPRGPQMPRMPQIALLELLLLLAIVFILIAAGFAFYDGTPSPISGLIGLVGLVIFVVALVVGWRDRFRPSSKPQWHGDSVDPYRQPSRARRGPFSALAAQIRIRRLRREYRRAQAQQDDPDD
ncbi:MAG TPA: hypothetical protein VFQ25_04415 [Ktedonobacterales bacterium]|nr:hypothetical protein [Ktedonobacterales bacterium]